MQTTKRILVVLLLAFASLVCQYDAQAANFVTKVVTASGASWSAAVWSNPPNTAVSAPVAGNAYELIFNGTAWGNNQADSRLRNPATDGLQTFPGDSLTLDADTDIRFKKGAAGGAISATISHFPGVGGQPGLILNGGILNAGDDAIFVVTGRVHVAAQSILSGGDNGGGAQKELRSIFLRGILTGPGNLVILQSGFTTPHMIDADASGYTGNWIIQDGFLQALTPNSLGRGHIFLSPTNQDPASASTNFAKFEPMFNLDTPGTLFASNNPVSSSAAQIVLHQSLRFARVIVDGVPVPNGTYDYATIAGAYPTHVAAGGSGSISVGPAAPTGLTAVPGDTLAFLSWSGSPSSLGYIIKRAPGTGGPYTPIATNGASTTFLDTNLVNGTPYYYVVSAINDGGESADSSEATVTPAIIPPLITVDPVGATNCSGANVAFSVTATGGYPLAYQWYTNDVVLAGQTNSTLTINNIQTANAGNYTVVVTNTGLSVTSAVAVLAIKQATVATGPASQTNCPSSSVTFTTAAIGSGALSYTWRKGGTLLQGPDGNNSYTIASVTPADAGVISVEVTGECNSTTNSATLTVVGLPVISAQPQNQATPMGNGAVFSITASTLATQPTTIQWQTNGVDVTGANGNTFAISNLTLAADGMQVRASVANCAGSLFSSAATLTVTPVSGISFDFNTPGQYTNAPYYLTYNNWINGGLLPASLAAPTLFEYPIGGVGPFPGSGSLELAPNQGNENTSILLPVNFDFSLPGKAVYASTMFKLKTPITAGRRATQLGLVTATNVGINDVSPQSFATVILQDPTANTPSFELHTQRRSAGGGLQESTVTSQTGLTVSNWYKLNVAFLNTKSAGSPSNYTMIASLQDMGPLGTTPGLTNLSFTTTTNTADIVQFKNVYLALRSFEDGGVETRDNTYVWTTPGDIFFVQGPQSQAVLQGNRAVLRAYVDGEGPYTYQWQKSVGGGAFSDIAGAGSWNYITPPAGPGEAADYRVMVTGPANTITSSSATLTVTPQTLAVVSAGSVDGTTVGVEFNQPVSAASAGNPANYTINGVAPTQARVYRSSLGALGPEGIYVVLTPASPLSGSFTVVASGVQDLSGGSIGAANSAVGSVAGLTGYDVNPGITGPPGENYSFGPGKFIVTGGGSDIFSGGDGFRYVYTTQTGDFDWVIKIPYMDTVRAANTTPPVTERAGFDARISLNPFSPGVFAGFDPGPIAEGSGNIRQFTEGTAKLTWGAGGTSWGNNTRLFHPDVWVRFRRAGNNFMRYSSTDGVNWTFNGQIQPFTAFDDQPTVYLGLAVVSARNLYAASAQFENFGSFAGYPGAAIAIASQPTNFTVAAGGSFTDGAVATLTGGGAPASAGELAYVWQRTNSAAGGWTNLATAGATNNTIGIGPLYFSDNGAQFRLLAQAPGALTATSAVFTATVTDTAAPTVTSVNPPIPSYQMSEVLISFNEPISGASAADIANYFVTNAAGVQLTVLSASFLSGDPRTVVLKVDGQLGVGNSSVGISGIRDLNNNLLATAVRSFATFATSYGPVAPVVVEYYQDIGTGADITALTANAMFTGGNPSWISYSNVLGANTLSAFTGSTFPGLTFSAGTVAEDNYGVKAYSYFVPPTNGQYKFWIRGDDFVQLFMNTNSVDSTNPAGKVLLSSLTANSANYSVGTTPANSFTNISLVAGQAYYMELLMKETGGGDGCSVMWTDPGVNTAPAQTVFIPTANLAYPLAAAPKTPVISEFYVGYTAALANNGGVATLTSATNLPSGATNYISNDNIEQVPNWKYIAGIPDFVGYQKYFGAQPQLANTRMDNYLGRLISYFVPPTNGNYKFYMRSDDASQLYMNTNAVNSTDAAGKMLIGRLDAFTGAYTMVGQNVSLIGGQKYYMEALWREGGGGDGVAIAVRSQGDATVPPIGPPPEVIPASMLEYPFEYGRAGSVNFTGILPGIAAEGQSLTLTPYGVTGGMIPGAGYGTDSPRVEYGYIWYKNGVRVLDNSFTNVTPPLTLSDNGAVYTLVMTNLFSRAERSVTLTVVADTAAPVVLRTVGWRGGDGFTIKFNERLDNASATYLGNYSANNGLQLLGATLDPSGTMLSIRTSQQAPGATYTVTINGVKDVSAAGNALSTSVNFSTWGLGGRGILVELFTNIVGATIGDLVGAPKFAANLPDVVYYTNSFSVGAFGANTGMENYGARVTALFVPTNTGYYRFYTRQDDAAMLFMNINGANTEDPNGKTMILHSQGANISLQDPRSISAPVFLDAGRRYYTEALMKEGTGGDYMLITFRNTDANGTAVGAVPPADAVTELMGVANFGAVPGNPDDFQIISAPPAELFVTENDAVDSLRLVVNAPASMLPYVTYQWARSNANSGVFIDIPGATFPALSPTGPFFVPVADDNAAYRVTASPPGATLSYTTLMHVTADTIAPFLVSASSLNGNTIGLRFSEPVNVDTAGDTGNYSVNSDAIVVLSATVRTNIDPRTVLLTLLSPVSGNFHVDAFSIADLSAAFNQGDSSADGFVQGFTGFDVGSPAAAGSSFTATNGEIEVVAGGADIWGTSDQGHLTLGQRTGNFDIWLRVDSLGVRTPPNSIDKAGLMVRETTNADSRTLYCDVNPPAANGGRDQGEAGQRVATTGATAAWPGSTSYTPAGIPNAWIRIKRVGNDFTAYRSSDGVAWTAFANTSVSFSNTVYVGLGTTAHNNTPPPVVASYKDIHIPNPPTISVQPSPASQTVPIHVPVSYAVTGVNAPNGGSLGYVWKKDGYVVAGATGATLNIADTAASDSGVYTVDVFNDGGAVVSVPVTLIVSNTVPSVTNDVVAISTPGGSLAINASVLLANDADAEGDPLSVAAVSGVYPVTYAVDFNDGLAPAGATVYSNGVVGASVKLSGGAGDSGYLEINPNVGSAAGSFIINELTPGKRVSAFTATFKLKVFPGSAEPADGFSFNFGNDLADGPGATFAAESGSTANGFSFCLDNYRFAPLNVGGSASSVGGGTANTSGLKINYKNVIIAGVQINTGQTPSAWNADRWVPVSITVLEDGSCTVLVDGTNVFGNLVLPNYTPSKGRFGLYGRTGGATEAHGVDDLSITVRTLDTGLVSSFSDGATLYGTADVNGGFLHLTDALNGQAGALVLNEITPGVAVNAFTASFTLRIGNGTVDAADGFSFNFASDLPLASGSAEEGAGTGLSVCVDNYPAAGPDAPAFKLKYGGVLIVPPIVIPKWNSANFIPVSIVLDAGGNLTLTVDGTNVVSNLPTGYTPTIGQFGLYARTGGQNETHWVDDLSINVTTAGAPGSYASDFNLTYGPGTVTLVNGVVTYTPPPNTCGTDTFYYIANDGQLGGNAVGEVTVSLCPVTGPVTLVSPTFSSGVFSASFASETGVSYQPQYKNNVTDPLWTSFGAPIPGDGTVKTFTDNGPLPPMRFYQVIVP